MRAIRQRTIFEQDRARRSIVDHKEIVAALEARDTERAERLVREHTLRLRDDLRRALSSDTGLTRLPMRRCSERDEHRNDCLSGQELKVDAAESGERATDEDSEGGNVAKRRA